MRTISEFNIFVHTIARHPDFVANAHAMRSEGDVKDMAAIVIDNATITDEIVARKCSIRNDDSSGSREAHTGKQTHSKC